MTNENYEILIKNIETLMRNRGINQAQLIKATGIPQSQMSKALSRTNKTQFTFEQIWKIADYFQVSIDFLAGRKNTSSVTSSPRAVATFLAELIENHYAKVTEYKKEEEIYDIFCDYQNQRTDYKILNKLITYTALYLPDYWEVPEAVPGDDDFDLVDEAEQVGNTTSMKQVNDFLRQYLKIYPLYDSGSIDETTYRAVLNQLLEKLRDN